MSRNISKTKIVTMTTTTLTLLFAIKWTDGSVSRYDQQMTAAEDNEIDTGPQEIVSRQENTIVQNDKAIEHDFISKKLPVVDETTLQFDYWNTKLGNNISVNIGFGNEKQIKQFWLQGKPLKLITHGFSRSNRNAEVTSIKSGYLATGVYNVITVDWSRVSKILLYQIPAYLTVDVGNVIARFLDNIVRMGLVEPSNIHLMGHSLGAHVVGAAGAAFTLGVIGRITGFDPAGIGFENIVLQREHLDVTDAEFVDVIHTTAKSFILGYTSPIGHADFYPNLGISPQPGCKEAFLPFAFISQLICSHLRSTEYFADSILDNKLFVAVQCPTAKEYVSGMCKKNPKNIMGENVNPNIKGVFYLEAITDTPAVGLLEGLDGFFD